MEGSLEMEESRQASPETELFFWSEQLKGCSLLWKWRLYTCGWWNLGFLLDKNGETLGIEEFIYLLVSFPAVWMQWIPAGVACGSPGQKLPQVFLVQSALLPAVSDSEAFRSLTLQRQSGHGLLRAVHRRVMGLWAASLDKNFGFAALLRRNMTEDRILDSLHWLPPVCVYQLIYSYYLQKNGFRGLQLVQW